jgi:hypothetical protein
MLRGTLGGRDRPVEGSLGSHRSRGIHAGSGFSQCGGSARIGRVNRWVALPREPAGEASLALLLRPRHNVLSAEQSARAFVRRPWPFGHERSAPGISGHPPSLLLRLKKTAHRCGAGSSASPRQPSSSRSSVGGGIRYSVDDRTLVTNPAVDLASTTRAERSAGARGRLSRHGARLSLRGRPGALRRSRPHPLREPPRRDLRRRRVSPRVRSLPGR